MRTRRQFLRYASGVALGAVLARTDAVHADEPSSYMAPGHGRFHHWYQYQQERLGVLTCCDEHSRDCGPVRDYRFLPDGSLEVFLEDGRWHTYTANPPNIFFVNTPDGRAHICRQPDVAEPDAFKFYCAFLPDTLA